METSKRKWITIKNPIGSCKMVIWEKENNLHKNYTKISGFLKDLKH